MEDVLEKNKKFDAKGLISEPSHEGRLKYWTTELCAKNPHTFDFVVTVRRRILNHYGPAYRYAARW